METKLEELRAAYEAATPGDWEPANRWRDGQYGLRLRDNTDYFDAAELSVNEDVGNSDFIALAHNLMPQLLEAVEALETCKGYLEKLSDIHEDKGAASAWAGVTRILENLK